MSRPLILLEFDDVIVVSRASRLEALRHAVAVDGLSVSEEVFDEQCAGLSFAAAARAIYARGPQATDETAIELAAARANRHYATTSARGTTLAPAISDFLHREAARSRLGLVAAAATDEVAKVLELSGLEDCFSIVECDGHGAHSLAQLWSRARLRLLRLSPGANAEVIALVASSNGFAAAGAAGCRADFVHAGSRET